MIFKRIVFTAFLCVKFLIPCVAAEQPVFFNVDAQPEKLRCISDVRIDNKVAKFERLLSRATWSKRILIAGCIAGVIAIASSAYWASTPQNDKATNNIDSAELKKIKTNLLLKQSQFFLDEHNQSSWNVVKKSFVQGLGVAACSFVGVTLYNVLNVGFGDAGQKLKNICGYSLNRLQETIATKTDKNMRLFSQSLILSKKITTEDLCFAGASIVADHAALVDTIEDLLALLEVCLQNFVDDEDDEAASLRLKNRAKNMRQQTKLLVQDLSEHIGLWLHAKNEADLQREYLNIINSYKQFGFMMQKTIEFCFSDRD